MIRQEDLQELMAYEAKGSKTTSLYLNVDTSQESSETIKKQVRSLLKENGVLSADASAIELYLDLTFGWDKPGLAIFSCASDEYFRVYPSAVAFRNRVRIGNKPHVKPLVHLLDHYAHYGVIVVDRVGARFFEYHLGEMQETDGTMGDDVRKLKTGGGSARSGGASSATGQRGGQGDRREQEVAQRNLREAAAASQQFFAGKPIRRLFLGGTAENVAQFRELLSKQLQSRIAGTFAIDMTAGEHEVRTRSLELLERANAEREQKLVNKMITAAAKGGNAVVGLSATLQTVSEGRVQILVISDGYRRPGFIDEGGNYLLARKHDGNSFGTRQLIEVDDVIEAAVSRTMEQGGNVEIVTDSLDLEKAGNIGALLRY